jgi:hypothetical protein
MLAKLRPRSAYDVMAALALFLVIAGGTAYAANTVFSADIVDGEVKVADLATGAVSTPKLKPAAVTTDKLAGGAVTTDKVRDNSLGGRDVLDNSLKGVDIDESTLSSIGGGGPAGGDLTGSYPNPEIAPDAVGSTEIRNAFGSSSDDVNASHVDGIDGVDILKRRAAGPGEPGAINLSWDAYQVNVFDSQSYRFGDVAITNSPSFPNQFFLCLVDGSPPSYNAPYVAYVNGGRQTGTISTGTCTSLINVGSGGDLHILSEGTQIFGYQRSFADQMWIFYGFSPT